MIQNEGRYIVLKDNSTKDIFLMGVYSAKDVLIILGGTTVFATFLWYTFDDPLITFQYGLYSLVILGILRFEIPELGIMIQTMMWKLIRYKTGIKSYQFKETRKYKD